MLEHLELFPPRLEQMIVCLIEEKYLSLYTCS